MTPVLRVEGCLHEAFIILCSLTGWFRHGSFLMFQGAVGEGRRRGGEGEFSIRGGVGLDTIVKHKWHFWKESNVSKIRWDTGNKTHCQIGCLPSFSYKCSARFLTASAPNRSWFKYNWNPGIGIGGLRFPRTCKIGTEVVEIAWVAKRRGQFLQLLKTQVILILNSTRPHTVTSTYYSFVSTEVSDNARCYTCCCLCVM